MDLSGLAKMKLDFLAPALPAVVGLIIGLLLLNPFLSDPSDNARYLVLGKSLATGRGFSLVSEPGSPADKLFPYGYSLLVALPLLAFGASGDPTAMVIPLKLANVVLFAGSLLLFYSLVAAWHSRAVALSASLLVALSPLALRLSTDVMSEIPFLFCSLVAITLTLKAAQSPRSTAKDVLAGIALASAFYIRTVGAALVIAALVYVVVTCRDRRFLTISFVVFLLSIPWLYQQVATPTPVSYATQFTGDVLQPRQEGVQEAAGLRLALVRDRLDTLKGYVTYEIPKALFPHLVDLSRGTVAPVLPLVKLGILLLIGLGLWERARTGPAMPELYVVVSIAALSFWWVIDRYLVPLVPFLALYSVLGSRRVALVLGQKAGFSRRPLALLLILPFVVFPLLQDLRATKLNLEGLGTQRPSEYYSAISPDYASFLSAAEWLSANTPPGSVVFSQKPYLMHIYSNRLAIPIPDVGTPEEIVRLIEESGAEYIVEDGLTWSSVTARVLTPAVGAHADRFILAHATASPTTRVWQYRRPLE